MKSFVYHMEHRAPTARDGILRDYFSGFSRGSRVPSSGPTVHDTLWTDRSTVWIPLE